MSCRLQPLQWAPTYEQTCALNAGIMVRMHAAFLTTEFRKRMADDLRQVAEIGLWEAWQRYDAADGEFSPFASRRIRGAMVDEVRRWRPFTRHAPSFEIVPFQDYDEHAPGAEVVYEHAVLHAERICRIFTAPMAVNQRKCAVRYYRYGQTAPEIARDERMSTGMVWQRLYHARKAVQAAA